MSGLPPHEKNALRTLLLSLGRDVERPVIYEGREIRPIPAICTGPRKHEWLEGNGNGAIRAPSLRNCLCFYCGRPLRIHPRHKGFKDAETLRRERAEAGPVQLTFDTAGKEAVRG
jgi:hypothetical protein